MMRYKKALIVLAVVIVVIPTTSAAASFTYSLIQGKTPSEALNILVEEIDRLTGKVSRLEEQQVQTETKAAAIEDSQDSTNAEVDTLKEKNDAFEKELAEQQAQRDNDRLCEELSKAGSQYLPTKQPIDELYEAILWQHDNSSLEQEYNEYVTEERERINSNYSIMSIDPYAAEHWNEADSGKTTLEKEYKEYVIGMEKALLKKQPMAIEEYAIDVDWESNNQGTQELLSKLKPHYDEYVSACQDNTLQ